MINKPSLSELQQIARRLTSDEDDPHHYDALLAAAEALPALLEIAMAAVAYWRPVRTEQDARDQHTVRLALDSALAKVRP